MNEKLAEYIRKRLELKHDILEIKSTLVHAGHDIALVEEHINHVLKAKKNRKTVLITAVLLIGILVIGSIFFYSDLTKAKDYYTEPSNCDVQCMDKKFLNEALIKNNASTCSKISDSKIKSECGKLLRGT